MSTTSRRDFLKAATITGIVATISGCEFGSNQTSSSNKSGAKRPNIIYILADDLGCGDLGCFGQKDIRTPNLDRMAHEGMRFTQHYSGSTVCAPSRSCLMTGHRTVQIEKAGKAFD